MVSHVGFHFLFFLSFSGRSASHVPSSFVPNACPRRTPFASRQACANRSSPMGPYLPPSTPTFQSIPPSLHEAIDPRSVSNAAFEKISRLPNHPYFTYLQFSRYMPSGGTYLSDSQYFKRLGIITASASSFTTQFAVEYSPAA